MSAPEESVEFEQWIENFIVVARDEIGMTNWTSKSVKANFLAHFKEGLTPYQALKRDGYPFTDDKKKRH